MMRVYLGTHMDGWLATSTIPLFVSRRRLMRRSRLPRASAPWVLDSGGFTELNRPRGEWSITTAQYVREVRRYRDEIGQLAWAAPMDWMCEPTVVAKTGLSVRAHQLRTLHNFVTLREELGQTIVPVLQGWRHDEYLVHLGDYQDAGFDLAAEPVVAVGSVCRRGQDDEIVRILDRLHREGLRMHAFGVRSGALERIADALVSADSMSWSYRARKLAREGVKPDHEHPRGGISCSNCRVFAERYYQRQIDRLAHTRIGAAA